VTTFTFILAEKASFPVTVLCEVLDVSTSGFYAWRKRRKSARQVEDEALTVEITAEHVAGRESYGTRRIHRALKKKGRRVSAKRIRRIRKQAGLQVKRRKRYKATTDSKHAEAIAPNVLGRAFEVAKPNTVWVTDVTYVWTLEGWLYLAVIVDLCSRRVVGWATSPNNDTALALLALTHAVLPRRPPRGWLHHSDRGSVYASADYRNALEVLGAIVSMSRKGNCWDNAVAESFFATLKGECLDHETLFTRTRATAVIGDYINEFYNLYRTHSTIGYLSPIEFELKLQSAHEAA
jgi:putative transposase